MEAFVTCWCPSVTTAPGAWQMLPPPLYLQPRHLCGEGTLCSARSCVQRVYMAPTWPPAPASGRFQAPAWLPPTPGLQVSLSGLPWALSPHLSTWPCPGPASGWVPNQPPDRASPDPPHAPPRGTFTVTPFPTCLTPTPCSRTTALRAFCLKSVGSTPPHPRDVLSPEPLLPTRVSGQPPSLAALPAPVRDCTPGGAPTMPDGARLHVSPR